MRKYLLVFAFILLLGNLFSSTALAQGSVPTDDEVNAIARKLYCPVCESTPLDVCPTQACKEWRELIRTMLSEGKTEEQILQHFVDQYGARVLAEPPKQGFFWLIYLIPPVVILIGIIMLFRSMRDWTKPKKDSSPAVPEQRELDAVQKDTYILQLEEELKKQK